MKLFFTIVVLTFSFLFISFSPIFAFTFASIGDIHAETANFTNTINRIKAMNPDFLIVNGDLENDGVISSEIDPVITIFKNASLYNNSFFVRGNHDDHVSGSAGLWQTYFKTANRPLPTRVTNYVGINSSSSYLTYSFDYDNSRFIGLDSNTYGDPPTTAQLTFLDQRLTDAESRGLTHAFIYTHPPEYCVDSTHCSCQTVTGCGPSSQFVSIINKHPIVSATFHGHEHVLAWVHMNNARVPGLTHEYEEFLTSPAGEPYGSTVFPARVDFSNYSSTAMAYGFIDVNGANFTVSFYHTDSTTPVWSQTFTKSGSTIAPTSTTGAATPTIAPTSTPPPSGGICQKMFIPAYFYPGALWTQASTAGGSKVAVMVMNPGNGPGNAMNTSYVSAVSQAKSAGIKVLGYVYSGYGTRSADIVKADIDKYVSWYQTDGIFIDEASGATTYLSYYQDLYTYIKAGGSNKTVIINPGSVPDESYVNVADNIIVFENDYSKYVNWNPPTWMNKYPPEKFTQIMYNTPASALTQALALSKQRQAGYVYMTDDVLSNPWDTLPNYWANEINQVCSSSPTPTPTVFPAGDANGDYKVDETDYGIWLGNFGKSVPTGRTAADFTADGKVDGIDYVLWLANYKP